MSVVQVVACQNYDYTHLRPAVQQCWEAIGAAEFIRPGCRVLLKPNLINSMPPERAVCTHPAIVRVVAELCLAQGAQVTIADQPGYALVEEAREAFSGTGMLEACAALEVDFQLLAGGGYEVIEIAGAKHFPEVQFARYLLEADVVINLPKAKTHSQTKYTGALKNMFGAVAPRQRVKLHLLGSPLALAEGLVDCFAARPPEFSLMDAVVCMEGLGPTQGQPVEVGVIAASRDSVALDAVCEAILGFRPGEVLTTACAARRGLGTNSLDDIVVQGITLEQARRPINKCPVSSSSFPRVLGPLLQSIVRARPRIIGSKCRACGACAGICPAHAITISGLAHVDERLCIECFCCQEACPFDAIGVQRSPLYSLARKTFQALSRLRPLGKR